MKRLFVICLLLAALGSLEAQVVVSGNLNYSNDGYSYSRKNLQAFNKELPNAMSLEVSPRMGFQVLDKLMLGFDLGFSYSAITFTDGMFSVDDGLWKETRITRNSMKNYFFGVFARYEVYGFGKLTVHAEIDCCYGFGKGGRVATEYAANSAEKLVFKNDIGQRNFDLRVVPVFSYSFSNHYVLDVYCDYLALVYQRTSTQISSMYLEGETSPNDDISQVKHSLNMGLNMKNTSVITIGFGYSF